MTPRLLTCTLIATTLTVATLITGCQTGTADHHTTSTSPQPAPSATNTTTPTPASAASPTPPGPPRLASIRLPKTLNGRPMLTDTRARQVSQHTIQSMTDNGYTSAVAAFYGNRGKQDQMWISASASPHTFTAARLTRHLQDYDGDSKYVTKVDTPFALAPGPLGGQVMCAKMTDGNGTITYPTTTCLWSDEHSYGTITWYQKTPAQVTKEFVSIRGQIEHFTAP